MLEDRFLKRLDEIALRVRGFNKPCAKEARESPLPPTRRPNKHSVLLRCIGR